MVYIMPIVLFLLGYAIAAALGAGEGVCIAVSFAALAVSAAPIAGAVVQKARQ